MTARYALYFAPDLESSLGQFGAAILDPQAPWARQTASARFYGFHATLKAPFELAVGQDLNKLKSALREFAAAHKSLDLPGLAPRRLGNFMALTCSKQPHELGKLHCALVQQFEVFRAPLKPEDIERHNPSRLTARQRENLMSYGYPYCFDDFEFHLTLGRGNLESAADLYESYVDGAPQICDRLAIFGQPDRKTRFSCLFSTPLVAP